MKTLSILFLIILLRSIILVKPQRLTSPLGSWQILQANIGISAMHMQVMHDNTVVMFDRTDFGPSLLPLGGGRCRVDPADTALQTDCTAHSVLYRPATNTFRPLTLLTDTWCSSGAVLPNGTLLQTGGFNDGDRAVRAFTPCPSEARESCDWAETPDYLAQRRWYASNQILPDGRVVVVGGRRQFNYEFFPGSGLFWMGFLRDTIDSDENNLYPFLHLLPDGNLFVFANTRSVSFDYDRNRVVREFPPIPGGDPRNYPSSGSSVLLPLDENNEVLVEAEVMICGGAPRGTHQAAVRGTSFAPALSSCGRIKVSDRNPSWAVEDMPVGRVMGDMVILPSGDVAILNGAARGTAGWEAAREPVMTPVLYSPPGGRFAVMAAAARPRLYHSAAVLIPDGRVLVGGSNPHVYYNFTGVEFPTDLSLEAFSPPYVSAAAARPRIVASEAELGYGRPFSVTFAAPEPEPDDVSFRLVAPSFSTHSFGMNQRMVVMRAAGVSRLAVPFVYGATVVAPSTPEIAPPGYYMLFVVHGGIPSVGTWVNLQR